MDPNSYLKHLSSLQVILTQEVPALGKVNAVASRGGHGRSRVGHASNALDCVHMQEGEIKTVPVGFWRNYLLPTGIAKIADASILE